MLLVCVSLCVWLLCLVWVCDVCLVSVGDCGCWSVAEVSCLECLCCGVFW